MTSYNLTIIVTYSEGVLSTSKFLKTAPGPPFIDLEKVTDENIEIHWLFNKWPVEGSDLNLSPTLSAWLLRGHTALKSIL